MGFHLCGVEHGLVSVSDSFRVLPAFLPQTKNMHVNWIGNEIDRGRVWEWLFRIKKIMFLQTLTSLYVVTLVIFILLLIHVNLKGCRTPTASPSRVWKQFYSLICINMKLPCLPQSTRGFFFLFASSQTLSSENFIRCWFGSEPTK